MAEINICLSCDDNYAKHAGVVIASVLTNSIKNESIAFYILDGGICNEHKQEILSLQSIKACKIVFVPIDSKMFYDYEHVKTHSYVSKATYYRLKLPTLLPQLDKIIYLDCDVIVNTSLQKLFETDMTEYLIAGILDINKRVVKKNPTYVNAGVLLFNLKNMRKENTEAKFLEWTIKNLEKIKAGDQTIINEVCKGKILLFNEEWNVQSSNFTNRSSYTKSPKIVHFVAKKKPWHWASFSYHRDLYFKYLQKTPWKLDKKDFIFWTKVNQWASIFSYIKYRPLFFIRPKFYEAIIKTYLLN